MSLLDARPVYKPFQYPWAYDAWLQQQAEREKAHHSRFEYSLGEYEVSGERIRRELSEFYRQYQWPEAEEENRK